MNNNESPQWQAVAQDKKGPSTRLRARQEEVSNGANLSSSDNATTDMSEARQGQPPGLDKKGPGSQPPPSATTKRNIRGLKGPKWTLAEKKVLLHCCHYSKFDKWSSSQEEMCGVYKLFCYGYI